MLIYLALTDKMSDREKITLLYEKYRKKMYYTAISILKDSYLAEDAVHEAFISIAKNIDKINDADSAEALAYVCRAARTRALNIAEKRNREAQNSRPLEDGEELPYEDSEFEKICTKCEIDRIAEAINRLPQNYRDVVVLRYLDDMNPSRIADVLGRKIDTVKKQLLRGRKMLLDMLKEAEK